MGNCCGIDGRTRSLGIHPMPRRPIEKEGLLGGSGGGGSGGGGDQVRIRISKQQLEELLRRVEVDHRGSGARRKTTTVEQVLQRLIDESDHFEIHHQRSWRPSLESIPEVN